MYMIMSVFLFTLINWAAKFNVLIISLCKAFMFGYPGWIFCPTKFKHRMFLKSRAGPITFEFVYLGYFCLKYLYCVTEISITRNFSSLHTDFFYIWVPKIQNRYKITLSDFWTPSFRELWFVDNIWHIFLIEILKFGPLWGPLEESLNFFWPQKKKKKMDIYPE